MFLPAIPFSSNSETGDLRACFLVFSHSLSRKTIDNMHLSWLYIFCRHAQSRQFLKSSPMWILNRIVWLYTPIDWLHPVASGWHSASIIVIGLPRRRVTERNSQSNGGDYNIFKCSTPIETWELRRICQRQWELVFSSKYTTDGLEIVANLANHT